ncbi:serine hydroxymethyltransferase [Pseudenhygromyxa sp. WMMC2535]|uniref:serine hydroxymethyltransferase n=1 Tax=Pseudenhygromyxa sp. WMMC2535 TaxID=2712867 RepID=UPI0015530473|nr:serine hydroxymethyltransferase [Pseudenhygromyxa sp. WMMC2535]NVB42155.1 serine hydroxymethyltransferase [Pseudenhygromyxa sp. WMMC2535]
MSHDPSLAQADPEIHGLIRAEDQRQRESLRLIASENYASRAVLEAGAASLTNKYAEGYPGRRYYEGMDNIDPLERIAIDRAKALFGAEHANVQPYSGSPANLAVLLGLCSPGDVTMGLSLPAGGHLTHGWKVSASGIYYKSVQYGVRQSDHRIDLDQVRELAREHRPKLIWVGHSAYPRTLDFAAFAEIASEVDAHLVADIAHIAGLVVGGAHPSPIPHCAAVTTTTHKTLRGPRGGLILCRKAHAKAIDKAVFPGLQGGPHNHATAAKAVAFHEAAQPSFREYAQRVVANAKALAEALMGRGYELVTGGTDNHLMLVDLSNRGISGRVAAKALNGCGIELNGNSIPFDERKPFDPSGVRIGAAALSSRGLAPAHMATVAELIDAGVTEAAANEGEVSEAFATQLRGRVAEFLSDFPAPGL